MPRATPNDDPKPVPPVQPDLDDCCHSGCIPCVFDLYDEALERYQAALAEWQARHGQEAQHGQEARHEQQSQYEQKARHGQQSQHGQNAQHGQQSQHEQQAQHGQNARQSKPRSRR